MKLKFWDRMVLFFGSLLILISGIVLVIIGLQIQGVIAESMPTWCRIVCIACGALSFLFGCYLLMLPWKYNKLHKNEFVVQRTDNGELRIAVKAIENLVQKCIDLHPEVRILKMNIQNDRDGVLVDLNISLANNISIPLAVASLQKQIKQYLAASAGIEVSEVRVSVETAQMEADPASYLEQEESAEAEAKPEKASEAPPAKKAPLHQRLFGKQDQPATVPEPPRQEAEDAEKEQPEAETEPEEESETEPADAPSWPSPKQAAPAVQPEADLTDAEPAPETEDDPNA